MHDETSLENVPAARRHTSARTSGCQPPDDWNILAGLEVEIHYRGQLVDVGVVECVTNDGDLLWLRQDGAVSRRIIEKTSDVLVRPHWP